jgi:AraC-like DNA-binding protein
MCIDSFGHTVDSDKHQDDPPELSGLSVIIEVGAAKRLVRRELCRSRSGRWQLTAEGKGAGMPVGAVGRFTDPEYYVANLHVMTVDLVVTGSGQFDGRLTWAQLRHIDLLCAQESLPRIAYVSLQPPAVMATFLMQSGPALLLNGVALQPGEIAFHARGERFHQRTTGAARWGLLAIAPRFASICAAALTGRRFRLPTTGAVFRPPSADMTRFLRLHARVGHLVEVRPARIGHPEVVRAIEQELIDMLMTCFCTGKPRNESAGTRRRADVMARFKHQLAAHPDRLPPMPELCAIIGTSQRHLVACCREFLDMSPNQYHRLRRLNRVRGAILNADPTKAKVSEIARSHHFTELGRFAASYREAFGERPSMTLLRVRNARAAGDGL